MDNLIFSEKEKEFIETYSDLIEVSCDSLENYVKLECCLDEFFGSYLEDARLRVLIPYIAGKTFTIDYGHYSDRLYVEEWGIDEVVYGVNSGTGISEGLKRILPGDIVDQIISRAKVLPGGRK